MTTGPTSLEQTGSSKSMSQHETEKELKNIWFNKESDGSSTHLPHLTLEECGKDWSEVARKQCTQCWGTNQLLKIGDVLSTTMCLVEQTLNARPLTPVSSDVNDFESITPNHLLLGNKNVCLPYLPCAEEFVNHIKLFRQTQAYSDLIWNRFKKEYLPTLNNRQKWNCESTRILNKGDLVWLVEDSDKRQ